jgi:ribonucleotide reductase class II
MVASQQRQIDFPASAPVAYPLFYRTYSRVTDEGQRESWEQVCRRTVAGLKELGALTDDETALLTRMQREVKSLPSGRWLWVGGTDWSKKPENFSGSYNCTSTNVLDWRAFGLMMDLAMQGCGTGAVLEDRYISQLPVIRNRLNVVIDGEIGSARPEEKHDSTVLAINGNRVIIQVGDSRQGWAESYQKLLELSSNSRFDAPVDVVVDLSSVRPSGARLRGFGGIANPVKLPGLYGRCAAILNKAIGRRLNAVECCLLIDEAASVVVAGNVRRSAGIRQFDSTDALAATAKDDLWQQNAEGNWRIDPERDALRMANHTRVFHQKPSLEDCTAAVQKQFYSGEGAIQWAGEAVARSNADLLNTPEKKREFIAQYVEGKGAEYLGALMADGPSFESELQHRLQRYALNPCGEIISADFFCNLSEVHLNQLNPHDFEAQNDAFTAAGLSVAVLLNHQFVEPRYKQAREFDPIVGVSFTGLFDFFVNAFGVDWLRWWEAGRPSNWSSLGEDAVWIPLGEKFSQANAEFMAQSEYFRLREQEYLTRWGNIAHQAVWDYCDRHGLKRPNRCTTVQPAGSKSLLTGASPGWHPPKAQRFIRRVTFRKGDPVALACIDYGYTVVPSQSDKDENGNLLNDPFDPRCTEWLVEIPVEVHWANLPGADAIHIERFSVAAQFDFYMQVQKHYTTHNTSATLEMREGEIEELAELIHNAIENDEGYISAALLARFDDLQTFPRLPFEPIDKATYDALSEAVLARRATDDFHTALARYDAGELVEAGPAGCDSDKCMMPEKKR